MRILINGVVVACLLLTLAAATAFGNTKRSAIVLTADTKVNDTVVKKGKYDVVFDDQTNELSIFKGAKLIAKTAVRIEKRDQKARGTEIQTTLEGMEQKLVSVAFGGSHENVVVGQSSMQTGAN
jgi:7-keto-8-aminopelargonate synthetase-like enzyme